MPKEQEGNHESSLFKPNHIFLVFQGLLQDTYHREQLKLPLPSELLKECVLLLSTLLYHCCGNTKTSNELDELLKRHSSLPLLCNDNSSMADYLPLSMGAHLCHLLIVIMDSCRLEHVTFKDLVMKSLSFLVCNSEEAKEAVIVGKSYYITMYTCVFICLYTWSILYMYLQCMNVLLQCTVHGAPLFSEVMCILHFIFSWISWEQYWKHKIPTC